jgi:hypothetical protein
MLSGTAFLPTKPTCAREGEDAQTPEEGQRRRQFRRRKRSASLETSAIEVRWLESTF